MNLQEFRELGYLQEANRLFFHLYGLAFGLTLDEETGECKFECIWDYRKDPEEMAFLDLTEKEAKEKCDNVAKEFDKHKEARIKLFGSIIQPIGSKLN